MIYLDAREYTFCVPINRAAKAALVSFDSTMRSNISVAPPIDLLIYRTDSFRAAHRAEVTEDDAYFRSIRKKYGEGIARVFDRLPDPDQFRGSGTLVFVVVLFM